MNPLVPIIDSHVHLTGSDQIANLVEICRVAEISRMNIVSIIDPKKVNDNPELFQAKAEHPSLFYVFGAPDHSTHFSDGKINAPSLAEQVDRLIELGADGLKLLETKPEERKMVDTPIDGEYYEEMFTRLEETDFPIVWHVADPEEFWDPSKLPAWAREQGWGYDRSFPSKEQLYRETENVLSRHPDLKVIFAHLYFLSADLPRASAFLDKFPNVHFDLSPGVEFLYNLSKDVDSARAFLVKYADRILFGTDIWGKLTVEESIVRSNLVRRWLETDDEYRIPEGADFLLGPPEDGVIRGLSLPSEVLEKIYLHNFQRIVGTEPKKLNLELARDETKRIEAEIPLLND